MDLTMRPFAGFADLAAVADLIHASSSTSRHRVDYPWRLSSPAGQSGRDVQLWVAPDGALIGFAAWYMWWATLDFYLRPSPAHLQVEEAIFAWAARHFHELDIERGRPLPYWAEARADDHERLALLARHGYILDEDYGYVMLGRPLAEPIPTASPPNGFVIRSLAGEQEVEAYVTLHRRAFKSAAMTADWRERTLRMRAYEPDLDLVAVAPNGRLAGFCVGWADTTARVAQIEPIGIDPDFQRQGLGRALLNEMLRRFRERGAEQALVETETSRSPARRTYEAAGFRTRYTSVRKGQWFSERD
ncbi:MAG: GNAT family N-acetyltransferase [Chloroflexota bacterium]|nr:GNAT family N-acetyltransferase [Chloroflexota bacterium]